ncbi:MAG TPA: Gfo/Idh/MocA family oxidoreductase [Terracidiphilus sp.]|nr:Gfo/Idh/MocA family oxidoreductase [Terracidiphilus sp.]
MDRRKFLQAGTGVAAGMLVLNARTALGYEANSAVRLGLLGCGNRGTSVATSFAENTSAQIAAIADLFPDRLAKGKDHFEQLNAKLGHPAIDASQMFHGPHAVNELADSKQIDLIQISTPPFFHVQHLGIAVASGKHVYCEKPVGIDIVQAKQALEIAKKVKPTQSVDVGFQCRNAPPIAAFAEKVQDGAIGKVITVVGRYNAPQSVEVKPTGPTPEEYRLRNWLWDRALSGDILVEQNIHIIDLANWFVGAHPVKAVATGGRDVLKHYGDCWDNYEVVYTYPNGARFTFTSTQFDNYGGFDAGLRLFGSEGSAEVAYSGPVNIKGGSPWAWQEGNGNGEGKFAANGAFSDNLQFADRDKERTFIASITDGPKHNQIAAGVETALSCMLGRMAGYTGREVSWDELLKHGETYKLGFSVEQFV